MPRGSKVDRTVTGQPYGVAAQQERAMAAVPAAPPPMVTPDEVPDLFDPTERPSEPLTTGMDIGVGPGREILGRMPATSDDASLAVRALYAQYPSPELERMMALLEEEGR